ncbi:MAG: hypothetical protein HC897_10025 [Thermoanaerobaculia bacterium]|nr:hypothetical protein [Thermoanaerobaculia bacterium]
MKNARLLVCVAMTFLLAGAAFAAAPVPGISSSLEITKTSLTNQEDVMVRFTLTNAAPTKPTCWCGRPPSRASTTISSPSPATASR